jgi:hypothetical protein
MLSGIAQAHAIAEASKEAMTDFEVMTMAAEIVKTANYLSEEELISLMFKYSGTLTANVATRITSILMTESQFNAMVEEVEMFDQISRDVLGE